MSQQLVNATLQMITFLGLEEAHAIKGQPYCTMSAMILKMTLNNADTNIEAEQRLIKELANLNLAFGVK